MYRITIAPGVIGSFRNKFSDMVVRASGKMNIYTYRDSRLLCFYLFNKGKTDSGHFSEICFSKAAAAFWNSFKRGAAAPE